MRASARIAATALYGLVLAVGLSCRDSNNLAPDETELADVLHVRLSAEFDTLAVGSSRQFSASVLTQYNIARPQVIDWSSTNTSVAVVSRLGLVEAITPGVAQIIAAAAGTADTATLVVQGSVSDLSIAPNAVNAMLGDSLLFQAFTSGRSIAPATLRWSSSNSNVIEVSERGVVQTVGPGNAVVKAEYLGVVASAWVDVKKNEIATVLVSPAIISLYPSQTQQFAASLLDANGRALSRRNVSWSSSSDAIANVSANGTVTGVGKGTAIISANADGKTASVTVTVLAVPAATVTVSLPAPSIGAGGTMQATAIVKDEAGNTLTGRTVGWYSSDPSIATVNNSGVVTAIAAGNIQISAIVDGKVGRTPLAVVTAVVTKLAIQPGAVSLQQGKTAQLSAKLYDQTNAELPAQTTTWSSSNASVATVSSAGIVTAVSPGTATIQAAAAGLTSTASVNVTTVAVASIRLSTTSFSLAPGATLQLSAVVADASGNALEGRVLTWTSSNAAVATVSNSGLVTGVGGGSATIQARVDNVTAAATATVTSNSSSAVATIDVTLNAASVSPGQSTQATATLRDEGGNVLTGRTVTWSSANPELATVSSSGLVTALKSGSVAIIAKAEGVTGATTLTVNSPPPVSVASIQVTAPSTSIIAGQTTQLSVAVRDSAGNLLTGRTIEFASSNTTVATVSSSGLVTGLDAGTATITASSGGKSHGIGIGVSKNASTPVPVASVTVWLSYQTLTVGQTAQASATLKDASGNVLNGRSITWSSSAPSVASVSSSGMVTAVAPGTAMIVATSEGKSGSTSLAVAAPTAATVTVTLTTSSLSIGQTTQATATARDALGNLLTGRPVSWTSSNPALASVSGSGLVTAISGGSATVTATIDGRSGSASVFVAGGGTATLPNPPALPQVYVNSTFIPPTGRTITVNAGGNLQSAIDEAVGGDVIMVQPGATFVGPFYLRKKTSGSGWITIRSAVSDGALPAAGRRMTPSYAAQLPKIVSAGLNASVFYTDAGASNWRLMALEVTVQSGVTTLNALVRLGDAMESVVANQASNIILDRMYIHGSGTLDLQRCIMLNSATAAIVDSYVSDCSSKGYDSQAIGGWNGPGPYKIVNNYLEATGENIMFGGADPKTVGLVPSDIEIRGNHIYKPSSWKGTGRVIKNLFEMKNGQRVLFEGNVLDGSWNEGQSGAAINLKTENSGGTAPWSITQDITIRNNRIKNAGAGIAMTGMGSGSGSLSQQTQRIAIVNNVFDNINVGIYTGDAYIFLASGGMKDVTMEHNTIVTTGSLSTLGSLDYAPAITRFAFRCNIMNTGVYGIKGSGSSTGTPSLETFTPSYTFTNNVLVGNSGPYPATTLFTSTLSSVGFVSLGSNYQLGSGSPYHGVCYDGRDAGADAAQVSAAVANVVVP